MNLPEKEGIINVYRKNEKKSIHINKRIDLFFIISILILIVAPIAVNLLNGRLEDTALKQITLYISPYFEELLGEEITESLLLEFKNQNPDLQIRLPDIPDTEPDILLFEEGDLNALIAADSLADLTSYNDETFTWQLAVPLVSFMDLLFYNIDILSAAGFDRPPKTREDFLAYARTVAESGNYGTAMSLSPLDRQALSRDIFSWIWASGSDFWSGENPPSLAPRALANDLTFLGRLYNERLLASRIFEATGAQRLEEFAQGRVAMIIASTRAIPVLRERMGDEAFGITTVPVSTPVGRYGIGISSIYAGINAACEYPDEAWSFLLFLSEQSPYLCEVLKAIPGVVSDVIPGSYVRDDPFYSKARDIFESSVIVQGFSGITSAQEYETAFLEELQTFFRTTRSPQDTVAAIQQRWNEIESHE